MSCKQCYFQFLVPRSLISHDKHFLTSHRKYTHTADLLSASSTELGKESGQPCLLLSISPQVLVNEIMQE